VVVREKLLPFPWRNKPGMVKVCDGALIVVGKAQPRGKNKEN
jgi:hypothetical protein